MSFQYSPDDCDEWAEELTSICKQELGERSADDLFRLVGAILLQLVEFLYINDLDPGTYTNLHSHPSLRAFNAHCLKVGALLILKKTQAQEEVENGRSQRE